MSSEWAEQTAAGANPNPANHGLPGKTLAAQREAMGWTVEQVADQLKMAVRQVTALEAGDYANLPGPAVVRGFVRAYAKVVKLDAAPLVAMIALETPELAEPGSRSVRRDKPATFSEVRFPTNGKRSRLPLGLIGAAVLLVAAGAGAWQFGLVPASLLGAGASQATPAAASGSQASVTVLPAPLVGDKPAATVAATPAPLETTLVKPDDRKPVIAPAPPLVSVVPPAGSTPSPTLATPVAGAAATPATAPAAATAAPAAAAGSNPLVLNVRDDSWIEVRRARGAPLLSRLVKAGTVETLDITEPVTLVVGKPGGVSATLRGEAVSLPDNGRAAKVKLK